MPITFSDGYGAVKLEKINVNEIKIRLEKESYIRDFIVKVTDFYNSEEAFQGIYESNGFVISEQDWVSVPEDNILIRVKTRKIIDYILE